MTEARIVAIGSSPAFRGQVARALEVGPDLIGYLPSATSAEEAVVNGEGADILVLAPEVKQPDAVGLAEFVGNASPTTAVVLVRDGAVNGILPVAMRAGIRDVVDLSQGGKELHEALERALRWSENLKSFRDVDVTQRARHGTIVSVFSSKGGSGKTFLTTNLAVALAEETGQDTAVIDLDFDMGDVFSYFGKESKHHVADLLALGDQQDRDALLEAGTQLHPHLWGYGAASNPATDHPSSQMTSKLLRNMRANFDWVVVDASVDYSDPALATFDLSEVVCLIAALDVVGVRHLAKALETLLSIEVPRDQLRLVLNRADSKVGLDPSDVERVMNLKVDAMIPSSGLVPSCLNKGRPLYLEEPQSGPAESIRDLAHKLIASASSEQSSTHSDQAPKRRLFGRR